MSARVYAAYAHARGARKRREACQRAFESEGTARREFTRAALARLCQPMRYDAAYATSAGRASQKTNYFMRLRLFDAACCRRRASSQTMMPCCPRRRKITIIDAARCRMIRTCDA